MANLYPTLGVTYETAGGTKFIVKGIEQVRRPGRERLTTFIDVQYLHNERSFKVTKRRFTKLAYKVADAEAPVPAPVPVPAPQPSPVEVESVRVSHVVAGEGSGDLIGQIAAAVAPYVKPGVDREQVERIVDERIVDSLLPRRVEVVVPGTGEVRDVGVQHCYFEAVRRVAGQRVNLWLVGPAGGGKTTLASAVAKSLGLPHYALSVCGLTSKADLIGYKNVSDGAYVRTDLREAYENGGVFLLDEVDAGNANVMVIMNAILANGHCPFPDGMVEKHPDFIMLAGANTVGLGADRQYVGRNPLDKATVDRFVMLDLPYDPAVEAVMAGVCPTAFAEADRPDPIEFVQIEDKSDEENDARLKRAAEERCADYCRKLIRIRKAVADLKVRHIVSPRATKAGCELIRLGFPVAKVFEMAVWKGLDADTVKKVEAQI